MSGSSAWTRQGWPSVRSDVWRARDRLRRGAHGVGAGRADEGVREALRVQVASRDQMTQDKTTNVNALLRVHDLGIDAPKPPSAAKIGEALPLTMPAKRTG